MNVLSHSNWSIHFSSQCPTLNQRTVLDISLPPTIVTIFRPPWIKCILGSLFQVLKAQQFAICCWMRWPLIFPYFHLLQFYSIYFLYSFKTMDTHLKIRIPWQWEQILRWFEPSFGLTPPFRDTGWLGIWRSEIPRSWHLAIGTFLWSGRSLVYYKSASAPCCQPCNELFLRNYYSNNRNIQFYLSALVVYIILY